MLNLMIYNESKNAKSSVIQGFPILRTRFIFIKKDINYMLLHDIGTILTKRFGLMPDLFTQLMAMYSAFIGKSLSREIVVKMVYDIS